MHQYIFASIHMPFICNEDDHKLSDMNIPVCVCLRHATLCLLLRGLINLTEQPVPRPPAPHTHTRLWHGLLCDWCYVCVCVWTNLCSILWGMCPARQQIEVSLSRTFNLKRTERKTQVKVTKDVHTVCSQVVSVASLCMCVSLGSRSRKDRSQVMLARYRETRSLQQQ